MHRKERFSKILSLLEEKKFITTVNLSKQLYVSLPTIRRDLTEMARLGLIIRSHGGAALLPQTTADNTYLASLFKETPTHLKDSDRKIMNYVSSVIFDGSSLYIDTPSIENIISAAILSHKNLTIVTNRTTLPGLLSPSVGKIICVSGLFHRGTCATYGEMALSEINSILYASAIISDISVSSSGKIFCSSQRRSYTIKTALYNADSTILFTNSQSYAADPSASYLIADINHIHNCRVISI